MYLEYEMSLLSLCISLLIDSTPILPILFAALVSPDLAQPPDAALLATPDAGLLAMAVGSATLPAPTVLRLLDPFLPRSRTCA